ncbi:hypothetical protein HDV00_006842 [Rhizophlyctis rosea]|nr:hypothetical protein HDV00_006842 [Rhizophlyctis rosea]
MGFAFSAPIYYTHPQPDHVPCWSVSILPDNHNSATVSRGLVFLPGVFSTSSRQDRTIALHNFIPQPIVTITVPTVHLRRTSTILPKIPRSACCARCQSYLIFYELHHISQDYDFFDKPEAFRNLLKTLLFNNYNTWFASNSDITDIELAACKCLRNASASLSGEFRCGFGIGGTRGLHMTGLQTMHQRLEAAEVPYHFAERSALMMIETEEGNFGAAYVVAGEAEEMEAFPHRYKVARWGDGTGMLLKDIGNYNWQELVS